MFHREVALLNWRVRELSTVVDDFVVAEATVTHSGKPRDLVGPAGLPLFADMSGRLHGIVVDGLPDGPDPWPREQKQREAIWAMGAALLAPADDTLIIVSDVDEVPFPEVVDRLAFSRLETPLYLRPHWFNFDWNTYLGGWAHASIRIFTAGFLRHLFAAGRGAELGKGAVPAREIEGLCGWHASWFGDDELILDKLASYAHAAEPRDRLARAGGAGGLRRRRASGCDMFGHRRTLNRHQFRMEFARESLFGPSHTLPAWYPRELLGTPFWSNIQNFPWLPNRLLVLISLDPRAPYTFAVATTLAALLASAFAYLFSRRIGLGAVASITAGWTFVACGYFASRIAAGHLPLLEAYFSLPLLLWLCESMMQAHERGDRVLATRWMLSLGASCGLVMLAGHPQLPVYLLSAAGVYVLWRSGNVRRAASGLAAMLIGVGCAGFALVPMAMLVARSTRALPGLDTPANDLAMPYRRLAGWWLPWLDGATRPLERVAQGGTEVFHGYPSAAYFWDTVCYAGWMPWVALLALVVCFIWRRARGASAVVPALLPPRVSLYLVLLGVAGIVLALPIVQRANPIHRPGHDSAQPGAAGIFDRVRARRCAGSRGSTRDEWDRSARSSACCCRSSFSRTWSTCGRWTGTSSSALRAAPGRRLKWPRRSRGASAMVGWRSTAISTSR